MKNTFCRQVTFFCLLSVFTLVGSARGNTPVQIKGVGDFYLSATGTVAFLPGVTNEDSAKAAHLFNVLENGGIYHLPKQKKYYFVVNHRMPGWDSTAIYLGVQVIKIRTNKPSSPLSLYRNSNWSRESDPSFDGTKKFRATIERKTVMYFFKAHGIALSINEIDRMLQGNKWHAMPYGPGGNGPHSWNKQILWTWSKKRRLDDFLRKRFGKLPKQFHLMMSGNLLRFTPTNIQVSKSPLHFSFIPGTAKAVYVSMFAPGCNDFTKTFRFILGEFKEREAGYEPLD